MPSRWQQWMPFRIDAFKGSPAVQAMHPAARIGYLYLLACSWQTEDCTLSCDPLELAEQSGLGDELWAVHGQRILRKFEWTDESHSRLRNDVLFDEWKEAKRVFDARRQAADRTNSSRSPHGHRDGEVSAPSRSADTHTQTGTGTEEQEASPLPRPEEFANAWNQGRGPLPKVEAFTDGRRKKVTARIRSGLTLERFAEAVKNCREKPFLRGDNDRGWTATFDWLVANSENVEKAITNLYGATNPNGGNGNGRPNQNQPSPTKQRIDGARRVLAEIAIARGLYDPPRADGGIDPPVSEPRPAGERG